MPRHQPVKYRRDSRLEAGPMQLQLRSLSEATWPLFGFEISPNTEIQNKILMNDNINVILG